MVNILNTTKMTAKGRVEIPKNTRNRYHLTSGAEFLVFESDDSIILKIIKKPSAKDFDAMMRKIRKNAKAAGIKPSDVRKAIAEVRGQK